MDKSSSVIGRLPAPKFWEKQVHICEEKMLIKSVHQARTNPDYKVKHPAECRDIPKGSLTVHPEAKIRILKELANRIKSVTPPPVNRPNRYNRS